MRYTNQAEVAECIPREPEDSSDHSTPTSDQSCTGFLLGVYYVKHYLLIYVIFEF